MMTERLPLFKAHRSLTVAALINRWEMQAGGSGCGWFQQLLGKRTSGLAGCLQSEKNGPGCPDRFQGFDDTR